MLREHSPLDELTCLLHRPEHALAASDVQERLVYRDLLDHRGDLAQDVHDGPGSRLVLIKVVGDDDQLAAEPEGLGDGHRRAHPVRSGGVGRRGDDATSLGAASHDDGLAPQQGIEEFLHGCKERIQVDVDDPSLGRDHGDSVGLTYDQRHIQAREDPVGDLLVRKVGVIGYGGLKLEVHCLKSDGRVGLSHDQITFGA